MLTSSSKLSSKIRSEEGGLPQSSMAMAKPEALVGFETSTLDIDPFAAETSRPESVLGLHFFVPANIMPLFEIVRGKATQRKRSLPLSRWPRGCVRRRVLSANAFGFIGNRMVVDYPHEAVALAEEGVSPERVDPSMKCFGFPMGPFAMSDFPASISSWRYKVRAEREQRAARISSSASSR